MSPGQLADREQPDPPPVELVADQDRVDAFGELVGAAQFAAELLGAVAGVLQVADEALLEVLARVAEGVAAELGADQDADREREEDRDQRYRVVARAVTHQPARRSMPSQILIFSQSRSARSLSAGEVAITITSRTVNTARKRTSGPIVEAGL